MAVCPMLTDSGTVRGPHPPERRQRTAGPSKRTWPHRVIERDPTAEEPVDVTPRCFAVGIEAGGPTLFRYL